MVQTSKSQGRLTKCCQNLLEGFSPKLFKALGDQNRIVILSSLAEACEPLTVSEVATCCPTDLSVVSRHLGMLRDAGIVEAEKRGRQVFYRVRYSELASALRQMADAIDACCPTDSKQGAES